MSSSKLSVVMLPGLLCDHRLWTHANAAFESERQVFIPDLSLDASIGLMAERVLDQAPAEFALVALSMGGYVAFEIMRRAPQRVARLALLDTMARADDPARTKARRGLLALAEMGRFKGVTPQLLPMLMHPRCLETAAAQVVQDMAQTMGKDGFIRQQQAIIERRDYIPVLAKIRVPTLVVVGEQDKITPLPESQLIHRHIAHSQLVTLPDCGHLPPLEHPERTTALLGQWLGNG
ncbi:alpha/beta fold hydrolase [Pseudomonas sp. NPDC089918]|uniref:alpha/beta fold hydrolase n=1 Tax=Pseudomonas sp. NPDC089918 TaxID=3390654 RepID=UPI003D0263C2